MGRLGAADGRGHGTRRLRCRGRRCTATRPWAGLVALPLTALLAGCPPASPEPESEAAEPEAPAPTAREAPEADAAAPAEDAPTPSATDAPAEDAPAPDLTAARPRPATALDDDEVGMRPDGVGLAPGARPDAFSVRDPEGAAVASADLLAAGRTLVVFYRGGWCPFCSFQLRELAAVHDEIEAREVRLVAVSVDRPEGAAATRAALEAPFPVLADPDLSAHDAFGVTLALEHPEVARLKEMGLDIEAWSGKSHHRMAVPSLFVLEGGEIRFAHVDPDYRRRPSPSQVLAVLDGLD
jgi:peroxiredoxin